MEDFLVKLLQYLIQGISTGSVYALLALGYTMVYGILKLINFAHGDVYMVGSYTGYFAASYFFMSTHAPLGIYSRTFDFDGILRAARDFNRKGGI